MNPTPLSPEPEPGKPEENPAAVGGLIPPSPSTYSSTNRRQLPLSLQRAYPLLLLASTMLSVIFCLMYINKPVVVEVGSTGTNDDPEAIQHPAKVKSESGLLPSRDHLPGDTNPAQASDKPIAGGTMNIIPSAPVHSQFEQTNMRVQHILTADSADGHLSRIDLEVPVLYQSRQMRWSPAEVGRARELMVQLMDYQDKTRQLRSEGRDLLVAWNQLVGQSIPSSQLRADSPSLPENQQDAIAATGPIDTTTRDAVEIEAQENP